MLRQFLSGLPLFDLPIVALAIFVTFFAAVLLRVLQRERAPEYRRMADLPLQDDSERRTRP
jgi:hypothetical protein